MKTLIRDTLLDGQIQDILIEGSRIHSVGHKLTPDEEDLKIIDGRETAALPSLVNAHTHSPMVLLRGAGDDMPLMDWLTKRMWPLENSFTEEDFYWGNRLAIAEMIRGGTGFFNEMYFKPRIALKALEDIPLKSMIHYPIIDGINPDDGRKMWKDCEVFFKESRPPAGVQLGVALHSVYADSRESIEWTRDFSRDLNLDVHIHLSESRKEVEDCRIQNEGRSPVQYLRDLGLLSDRLLAAHTVHLDDDDVDILADHGVTVIHNPISNMKLGNGVFPYQRLKEKNVRILLGTDGAGSNNNLDMLEEMKFAALLQKSATGDPSILPAHEILKIATEAGAERFGTGGGFIRPGMEADIMLVDTGEAQMTPLWNLSSSLVYSAAAGDVKTLLVSGKVLMENKKIPGFDEIRGQCVKLQQRLREKHDIS